MEKNIPADRERFYQHWTTHQYPDLEIAADWRDGWLVAYGKSDETLLEDRNDQSPASPIILPHRELRPNSSFWYSRTIEFPGPGVLRISADDGAQVFINGSRRNRLAGDFFRIDSAGTYNLTIRILNNAMEGGLRSVIYSTHAQYAQFKRKLDEHNRILLLLEKVILVEHLPARWNALMNSFFDNPTTEAIVRAEQEMKEAPMLFACLIGSRDNPVLTVLTDSRYPVMAKLSSNGVEKTLMGSGPVAKFPLELEDGKSLSYVVSSGKTQTASVVVSDPGSFRSWSFQVWADSQGGWKTFYTHLSNSVEYNDAFSVGVGDLVSNGSDSSQWASFFKVLSTRASGIPFLLVPGNHDYDGYYDNLFPDWYTRYTSYEPVNYFSWRYQDAAFISLDLNETFPIGFKAEQKKWFFEQVENEAWTKATWRFVLMHQPPFSSGWPGYEGDDAIRELLEPIIEKAGIDVVVSGHTHDYERKTQTYGDQRTTFWIVGGAGGTLEPAGAPSTALMDTVISRHHTGRFFIQGDSIRFEAIDVKGNLMDSYLIVDK